MFAARWEEVWILCPEDGCPEYLEAFQTHIWVFRCEMGPESIELLVIERRDTGAS